MVIYILLMLSFLTTPFKIESARSFSYQDVTVKIPPKVTVEIVGDPISESSEIVGVITIVHEFQQKVEESSFLLGDIPLKVEKIEETSVAPSELFKESDASRLIVTKYRFKLPPQPKGLYLLDIIQVKVGDNEVYANPITYTVVGSDSTAKSPTSSPPSPQPPPSSSNTTPPTTSSPQQNKQTNELKLTFAIKDKEPFYPGQRVVFEYKIEFQNAIELTKEELQVFQLDNFRNIGAPKVETHSAGAATIQTITQEAVALKSGTTHVPPSVIEGYVFSEDAYGRKVYTSSILHAETEAIDITVSPFPEKDKPLSFNGALGLFSWKTRILNPHTFSVGENISLEILVTGRGEFDTVTLPDFNLQQGFKGNFKFPDVLPLGEVVGGAKRFVIEFAPLVPTLTQIPEMAFSSFDTVLNRYFVTKAPPIPMMIKAGEKRSKEKQTPKQSTPLVEKKETAPIEIEGSLPVTEKDVSGEHIDFSSLIIILLLLIALFLLQIFVMSWWRGRAQNASKTTSRNLFMQALKSRYNSQVSFPLIEKALLLRLYEIGDIQTSVLHPEELPDIGIAGEIKKFLLTLDKRRFSGLGGEQETKEVIDEATQLYYRLSSSPEKKAPNL